MLQANPYAVSPPPPGSIGVGELMVDALTKRMWVGVAATTDPLQALLVGDIVALQTEDADIRADFTDLLNAGLSGKSNVGHTHTASQITDFNAAVGAVVGPGSGVPVGCVVMYGGLLSAIGSGPLAGWMLCDGRSFDQVTFPELFTVLGKNTVPDLKDRFAYGAGNLPVGAVGGNNNLVFNTSAAGQHSHGGATGSTAISIAQMPWHGHGVSDPGHSHSVAGNSHNHNYTRYAETTTVALLGSGAIGGIWRNTNTAVNSETVNPPAYAVANYTGISIAGEGGGQGHYHTIGQDGNHTHAINITNGNLPLFVALAYIIKT